MNYAKINVFDVGDAMQKGENIKRTRLLNKAASEKLKTDQANLEMYGDFMSKEDKALADTDKNGVISPEEKINAGRKFKAYTNIENVKERRIDRAQIRANRAAAEGRANRRMAMTEEKFKVWKTQKAELDDIKSGLYDFAYEKAKKMQGLTPEQQKLYAKTFVKNLDTATKIFNDYSLQEQAVAVKNIETELQMTSAIQNAYSTTLKGTPPDQNPKAKAEAAAKGAITNTLDAMQKKIDAAVKRGDKQTAKILTEKRDNFKNAVYDEKGNYDPDGINQYAAEQAYLFKSANNTLGFQEIQAEIKQNKKHKITAKQSDMQMASEYAKIDPNKRTPTQKRFLDSYFGIPKKITAAEKAVDKAYPTGMLEENSDENKKIARKIKKYLPKAARANPNASTTQIIEVAEKMAGGNRKTKSKMVKLKDVPSEMIGKTKILKDGTKVKFTKDGYIVL